MSKIQQRKESQKQINSIVCSAWKKAEVEFMEKQNSAYPMGWKRLRSCEAYVVETANYIFLKSYNTLVAFIDKENLYCYDVLRLVYGYTATSAQHISKFFSDYSTPTWKERTRYTYYPVEL